MLDNEGFLMPDEGAVELDASDVSLGSNRFIPEPHTAHQGLLSFHSFYDDSLRTWAFEV